MLVMLSGTKFEEEGMTSFDTHASSNMTSAIATKFLLKPAPKSNKASAHPTSELAACASSRAQSARAAQPLPQHPPRL